jgi:hypothetical protein
MQSCVISITFENFTTQSCCDFVRLLDGPTVNSSLITSLSGTDIDLRRRTFNSTQKYMFVSFDTDSSGTASGFTATFQSGKKTL